ncbi:MAG: hypothetical protein AAFZ65_14950, partial [Planctomycetota bacterium]
MPQLPDDGAPIRIAMWSGPRNLSTALMRSFEARGDCAVSDEPLYAHYLDATGLDHPGREATLASQPRDWRVVAEALVGPGFQMSCAATTALVAVFGALRRFDLSGLPRWSRPILSV